MKLGKYAIVALISGVSLVGCSGEDQDSASALPSEMVDTLQGHWEKRGYGKAITIDGYTITSYDFTTESCFLTDIDAVDDFEGLELTDENTAFTLTEVAASFSEKYYRLESLPGPCSTQVSDTPADIYNHVWHTFNEYYAFFDERNVNWLTQLDATRDDVRMDMSSDELFDVLSTLIEPIDDQHVSLATPTRSYDPGQPKGFLVKLQEEFDAQTEVADLESYVARELALWESNLESNYLDNEYDSAGGPLENIFTWGTIGDDVGYLRIDLMILNFEQGIASQVEQVELILDTALQALADTQALVVDVRMNPGGTDAVSFAIANRFTDTQRLAVSKFARSVRGQEETQSVLLNPVDRPSYLNPVVLVTSALTTSGAEVFTLAMRSIPHVTHLGEQTNGALSDVLEKGLPNGWGFELANEVYLDSNGLGYEGAGIPPRLAVPVFDHSARHAGRDSAIDAALQHLGFGEQ